MERAVVEYLANALWQAPLLVAGVAALLWALGSDVRTRHRVWLAVLMVAMLLPLRGMDYGDAPTVRIVTMSASAAPAPSIGAAHGPQTAMPADDVDFPVTRIEGLAPAHKHGLVLSPAATRWMVRLYGVALAFCAWRVLRAWIAAQGLLRRSRSIDLAPRAMAIFAQAAEAADVPLPRLRQSDETVSPVVIGAVKPVLLLPAGFDRLKDDEILAALSHEFAHLARRDYLVNLVCQIGALPLAWHPAIQYVQKRIRDTREMLCDAAAAREMASPVRYATCLVAFALRALDGPDAALATQGLSMFDNRILEERILQLTQAPVVPEPSTRLARLAGASIGLVMAVMMALMFHITPTWADTPSSPVQLTPPIDLPAIPAAPDAPAAPAAPPAPAISSAPAKLRPVVVIHNDDDTKRAIAEEERERADRQREQAQRQRDEAQRQREEGQRQREAALQEAEHQREVAQLQREEALRQREEAQRQREAAHEQADRQRELAQQQREQAREMAERQRDQEREVSQHQRDSSRAAIEEARRGAVEASRAYAAEVKRQVAEAMKAGQAVQDVDMEKIRQEIALATASVHTPEFRQQMVDLQNHIEQLQDNMSQLKAQMKSLNHEVERSVN